MEWLAFLGAVRAWVKRMLGRRPPSMRIVVKDGGTLNVVQGDQHIHYHIAGPAEVVSDKPIRVIKVSASETIGLSESHEVKLIPKDGKTEEQ